MRYARAIFAFAAVAWLALLVAAPLALSGVPTAGLTYAFGSLICHQRPERSFHIGLGQFPVCARCLGLYAGAAVGAIAFMVRGVSRKALAAAALPTAMTWVAEIAGVWSPSNVTRFAAALPLGVAVALTVNYLECVRPQPNASRLPPTPI